MKLLILLFLFFSGIFCNAQTQLVSWNIENFGNSKKVGSLEFIANTLKDADVIALQEIVAGYGGAQAVAKLVDELNRKGVHWDYTISDPTSSTPGKKERYAFIWKTHKVKKIGKAWLEKKYHQEIEREPYFCTFEQDGRQFTIVNFHAIPKKLQPETEIKYFKFLPEEYPTLNLVFVGDFNCPQSHTVFNPLKSMGYQSAFQNQKTSLKRECKQDDCLASEYDNIFYNSNLIKVINKEVIPFYTSFSDLKKAREVSDHLPIAIQFTNNYNTL
jgi:endonuclease/exonuclease/phosphatase family metal-dependent hydrolase